MNDDLKLKIVLDTGEVVDGFLNLEKKGNKSAQSLSSSFGGFADGLSGKIKTLGLTLAAAFTVNKLVNFLENSSRAAAEAERATNALASSLSQIGKFSTVAVDSFSAYAANLQRTTGIEDDLIKQNAALLVSIGNLSGQGLEQATKASLDLSRALQIDVGTAFDLVAKAAAGNTGALSRYVIKIDESIPKSEKFAATLNLIQTRFGGLAETNLNTFEGALANLSNSFGEFQESIGAIITQSPALRAVINEIANLFFSLSDTVAKFQSSNGDVLAPIIQSVINFGLVVNEFFIKPLELGFNLLKIGIMSLKLVLDTVVVAVLSFSKLIVEAIVFPIRDVISALGSLASLVSGEFGSRIKEAGASFGAFFTTPLEAELAKAKGIADSSFNAVADAADNAFVSRFGSSVQGFLANLKTAAENAKGIEAEFVNNSTNTANTIKGIYEDLSRSLKTTLVGGISNAFQDVGKRLQRGEGLFDDFGNSVVGIIGDLLIQIGNALIVQGFAIELFIQAINKLLPGSGLAAAAAGIGLVIFGAALKSAVGKGGGSSAGASSGGGIASSPSENTQLTQQQDLDRQEASTSVSVVIQGDVLDSDESGSRIVDLINQAFDKKGVVINQGVMA